MKNLAKAIIAVMSEVKGIEKTKDVGYGNSSYKAVEDKIVKQVIGDAMQRHGLCILPIGIEDEVLNERWQDGEKQKTMAFTKVRTKYLLLHESGESIELTGYGHGVDSQDKSAGKATTYALKYTLLYTFLVPTGKIDDTEVAPKNQEPPKSKDKPILKPDTDSYHAAVQAVASGKFTLADVQRKYEIKNVALFEADVETAQNAKA